MPYVNEKLRELNQYLKNRKVAIIGLGVSNEPLLDYMHKVGAKVTIFENKTEDKIAKDILKKVKDYGMEYFFGPDNLEHLVGFDIIFRSPICLPTKAELQAEEKRGAIVTSEIEMLMKLCPGKIIGVTGSDGKTTTTSLIYQILKHNEFSCYVGGNIGTPLFTKLGEMTPEDIVVLELSSFQLMGMEISPDIAVITNITPNHLNVHKDYDEYIDAKKNIFKYQDENGIVVLNYDNPLTRAAATEANGKVIYFSSKNKLDDGMIVDNDVIKECKDKLRRHILDTKDVHLRGIHNYENICAALAATQSIVPIEDAVSAVKEFTGVAHRLEFIRELDGVKWYNDSIGTSPTRTIAGLQSFDERIVLIAGGYDKQLDYTPIAKPILEKVDALILIGDTGPKIFDAVKDECEKQKKDIPIYMCGDFEQLVQTARNVAKPGQIVLFSPASASFDMFKNFEERGNLFKELVNNLQEEKPDQDN